MRILIAEDHRLIADNLAKGLKQAKYTADIAADGEEAVQKASAENYDLVILDLGLPKKDGLVVARELRAKGKTMPILMLTARDLTEQKIAGLDAGADDYLVKPFDFEELLARIRALLRRPTPTKKTVLQVGDLTLDPASHTVRRGKQVIALAPREYALLEFLLRSPGVVKSRVEILEHVWGAVTDDLLFSDTVDVHISYLRKKIDRTAKKKLIKTVKGAGYKIEA
jgi:DNA-binding response OmpR family regulator